MGGQPCKPGFIISLQQRSLQVALFVQCVDASLPRPDERRHDRFRHGFLSHSFCVPQQLILDDYIPRYGEKQVFPNSSAQMDEATEGEGEMCDFCEAPSSEK